MKKAALKTEPLGEQVQTSPPSKKISWTSKAIEEARARRAGWGSAALANLIAQAESTWGKLLFPTPRIESWKYTNTESIAAGSFVLADGKTKTVLREKIDTYTVSELKPITLVTVDGFFSEEFSTIENQDGVEIIRGKEIESGAREDVAALVGKSALHENTPFGALATALMSDVVCIRVAPGSTIRRPIQFISVVSQESASGDGVVVVPRIVVVVGANAKLSIIDTYVGEGSGSYLSLPVIEAFVKEGAHLEYSKIGQDASEAFHVSHVTVEQERASSVVSHFFSLGGKLVRNNVDIELKGSNCDSIVNGLSVLSRQQHVDNSTVIHHIEPNSESRELFKGIYNDKSRGVFSGTIVVESEAQKTNAFQSNQSLLLSSEASVETRPQLKIWADDVKCTHGATIGQLDMEALFYLRSRGLGLEAARNFLVQAFAGEVTASLQSPELREYVEGLVEGKLHS